MMLNSSFCLCINGKCKSIYVVEYVDMQCGCIIDFSAFNFIILLLFFEYILVPSKGACLIMI